MHFEISSKNRNLIIILYSACVEYKSAVAFHFPAISFANIFGKTLENESDWFDKN